jgi:hypothetical protein
VNLVEGEGFIVFGLGCNVNMESLSMSIDGKEFWGGFGDFLTDICESFLTGHCVFSTVGSSAY